MMTKDYPALTDTNDHAEAVALEALSYIFDDEDRLDRFLALTGIDSGAIRGLIQSRDFLVSVLDFFIQFEPDLIAFAENRQQKPEMIVHAWRQLGGGVGQEW